MTDWQHVLATFNDTTSMTTFLVYTLALEMPPQKGQVSPGHSMGLPTQRITCRLVTGKKHKETASFPLKKCLGGVLFRFIQSHKYRQGDRGRGDSSCEMTRMSGVSGKWSVVHGAQSFMKETIECSLLFMPIISAGVATAMSGGTCGQVDVFFGKRPPAPGYPPSWVG